MKNVTVKNEYDVEISYQAAVDLMDDEIREMLHGSSDIDSEQDFFDRYCAAHEARFGEEFELAKRNPVF